MTMYAENMKTMTSQETVTSGARTWQVAPEGFAGIACWQCNKYPIRQESEGMRGFRTNCAYCDAMVEVRGVLPGNVSVVKSDVSMFNDDTARSSLWYHATRRENWYEGLFVNSMAPLVHLGSEMAARSRMAQVSRRLAGPWYLHAVTLNSDAVLHPEVIEDENEKAPYYSGDENRVSNYSTLTRYVNRFESVGSVSIIANPSAIKVVQTIIL